MGEGSTVSLSRMIGLGLVLGFGLGFGLGLGLELDGRRSHG